MMVKRLAVDVDVFAEGNDFAADLFRRTEELVADGGADDADVAGVFVVDLVEHAAVFDDVLVHFERVGPGADEVARRSMVLPPSVTRCARGRAFPASTMRDERRAGLQGIDVVDGDADGLIGEVLLRRRGCPALRCGLFPNRRWRSAPSRIPFSMPLTSADMATRLETPRMMPSMVSNERNLCAQISLKPTHGVEEVHANAYVSLRSRHGLTSDSGRAPASFGVRLRSRSCRRGFRCGAG